uniref:Cytochrome P450 n=1 Tax=Anopheles culicifacies TaxID=139723 RepID=A0A182MN08_9DIPT
MEPITLVLTGFIFVVSIVYLFVRSKHNFWKDQGVPYAPNPHFFYGHVKGQSRTRHGADINQELYQQFKQRGVPYGGISLFIMPSLIEEIEMKDVLGRFTTDVIGTCAFGIECNTLKTPDSEFRKYGNKAFELDPVTLTKFFFASSYPQLARKLHVRTTQQDVEDFFMKIVRETVDYRESNNVQRNDFMNLLLQIKNKGKLQDHDTIVGKGEVGLTHNELAAQVLIFFLAGFETSSTTLSFCLYELAKNPGIQDRLRDEITRAIDDNGGEVTYDVAMNIQYLDNVINETLRKYPPVETLTRKPAHDYVIPGTKHIIPEGTIVQIPIYAIQRPRICIGLRFGVMQTKVGLINLLRKFRFTPSARTPERVVFDPKMFTLSPTGGNYLKVEKVV